MKSNYLISLIMFLAGIIFYFIPKNWITSDVGLKIPFSLEKNGRVDITNKFFGKTLIFGGPLSAIICFLISVSPIKTRITENIYNSIDVSIILILVLFTEINLRLKNKR